MLCPPKKTMEMRRLLILVFACIVLNVGSFRGSPFLHGKMLGYARSAARKAVALEGQKKALVAPVTKRFSPISSREKMLETVEGLSESLSPQTYENSDIPMVKKEGVIKSFRSHIRPHVPWNATTDTLLREGVEMFGTTNWSRVADHVCHGKSLMHCMNRYNTYLRNEAGGGTWTEEEITKLRELVTKAKKPVWSHLKGAFVEPKVNWIKIGQELGRLPRRCTIKWESIEYEQKGRFTPEEDKFIQRRVQKWGDRGKGLWVSLSKEMGRTASSINNRWKILERERSGSHAYVFWTDEMDALLLKTREDFAGEIRARQGVWAAVCAALSAAGHKLTSKQCESRWESHLKYTTAGMRSVPDWTPELVQQMMELREQGENWNHIAHTVNIFPRACQAKWNQLEKKNDVKRGAYTPEENEAIRREASGNPHPNWHKLEMELDRPAKNLRQRWEGVLFFKTDEAFNGTRSDAKGFAT